MMLQIGFGMSAASSGLITFSSSVGSLVMRTVAPRLLRLWGFRNVLVWVGLVAVLLLTVSAAFRPSWPVVLIYAVLMVGGFFQSLQFIAYNTIAYADVPRPADECSDELLHDIPAVGVDARDCHFGRRAGWIGRRARPRPAATGGFFHRVPGGRRGGDAGPGHEPGAAPRCRGRTERPPCPADNSARRIALRRPSSKRSR